MSWRTISPSEIRVSPRERKLVAQQMEREDTLDEIIANTSEEIQGIVATRSPVGPSGTFPSELIEAAKALIAVRFLGQITSDDLITETRATAAKSADSRLKLVASGDLRIVGPEQPAPEQAMPGIDTIHPGNSGQSRQDLQRL